MDLGDAQLIAQDIEGRQYSDDLPVHAISEYPSTQVRSEAMERAQGPAEASQGAASDTKDSWSPWMAPSQSTDEEMQNALVIEDQAVEYVSQFLPEFLTLMLTSLTQDYDDKRRSSASAN